MCKVVCAMGFGPIGFMTSFVSCDETSVPICGQTTAESTGCMHVSCVLGVAKAVYILDLCCVLPRVVHVLWALQRLVSLSTSGRGLCASVFLWWVSCAMECATFIKNVIMWARRPGPAHRPCDPLLWHRIAVWTSKVIVRYRLMGIEASVCSDE